VIKILFIINPISGGLDKAKIIKAIPKLLDKEKFDIYIKHTKQAGFAAKIANKAVKEDMDIVVAVGGDGTINEIASQLVNTKTALAIVPCGSGNGLARDLKIPLNYKNAIQLINDFELKKIDVGVCNKKHFFSLCGVGFDAKVAYDFNRGKQRKLLGYAWVILKDIFKTKNQYFKIELDEEIITGKFFLITIANSSQWGYNVKVAPKAKLDDGMLAVNFCKKPSLFSIIPFGIKLLSGKIDHSKYVVIKNTTKISLNSKMKFYYHIDGDAKGVAQQIKVEILHKALNVIGK
jgi:YegS/Rv2252/BmrU family lipid kinase